jgi:hypothetical protein
LLAILIINMNPLPNDRVASMASGSAPPAVGTGTSPINEKQMMLRLAFAKPNFLPIGYEPTALDVCCGRGKKNWRHQGNISFRRIIRIRVDSYISAPTKQDKSSIVVAIVDDIRLLGGKFLKQDDSGRWYDIGDSQARDKVGHSLRDQVTALSKQKDRKPASLPSSLSSSPQPSRKKPESTFGLSASFQTAPYISSATAEAPPAFTTATPMLSSSAAAAACRQDVDEFNINSRHPFISYQQAVSQRRSEPSLPSALASLLSNSFTKRPSMGLDEHVAHGLDLLEPMDDLRLLPTPTTTSMSMMHHRLFNRGASFADAMEQGRVRLEPNFQQPLDASVEPTPIEQMLHHQKEQADMKRQKNSLAANFQPLPADDANQAQLLYPSFQSNNNINSNHSNMMFPPYE